MNSQPNTGADAGRQTVFYVYPDGIFPKKEKMALLERAYGRKSRPAEKKQAEMIARSYDISDKKYADAIAGELTGTH